MEEILLSYLKNNTPVPQEFLNKYKQVLQKNAEKYVISLAQFGDTYRFAKSLSKICFLYTLVCDPPTMLRNCIKYNDFRFARLYKLARSRLQLWYKDSESYAEVALMISGHIKPNWNTLYTVLSRKWDDLTLILLNYLEKWKLKSGLEQLPQVPDWLFPAFSYDLTDIATEMALRSKDSNEFFRWVSLFTTKWNPVESYVVEHLEEKVDRFSLYVLVLRKKLEKMLDLITETTRKKIAELFFRERKMYEEVVKDVVLLERLRRERRERKYETP